MKEENFEEMMKKLEEISKELEVGNLSLDESVKKFEEGMEISKKCSEVLNQAEKRISILVEKDNNITEEKFSIE